MKRENEITTIKIILNTSPVGVDFLGEIESSEIRNMNLITDLGFDSISLIALVVDLEEQFEIEFEDDMLLMDSISTIGKIIEAIDSMLV